MLIELSQLLPACHDDGYRQFTDQDLINQFVSLFLVVI